MTPEQVNLVKHAIEAHESLLKAYRDSVKLWDQNHDDTYTSKSHNAIASLRKLIAEAEQQAAEPTEAMKLSRRAQRMYAESPTYRCTTPMTWSEAPLAVKREWLDKARAAEDMSTVRGLGVQWLVLPDERKINYTNFEDGRYGDASELVAKVNADPALNQGHADWRLPTIDELKTLIDTQDDPKADWYWSSSPLVGNPNYAWYVCFGSGSDGYYLRDGSYHVRLVRSVP